MKKFLIQTINGKIKHDFSFQLIDSIEYNNWMLGENRFSYIFTNEINKDIGDIYDTTPFEIVPIGSVEFVHEYLETFFGCVPKPINVPSQLMEKYFSNRNIINGTEKDIIGKKFVKSNDKIKGFIGEVTSAPLGNYQISDIIEMKSEWRVFVYKNKLVGLKNYSGEFDVFPDVVKIRNMVNKYKNCPVAYVLDVGVCRNVRGIDINCTFVIEVHNFYSCGLYGFNHSILPHMFADWFKEFVNGFYK